MGKIKAHYSPLLLSQIKDLRKQAKSMDFNKNDSSYLHRAKCFYVLFHIKSFHPPKNLWKKKPSLSSLKHEEIRHRKVK